MGKKKRNAHKKRQLRRGTATKKTAESSSDSDAETLENIFQKSTEQYDKFCVMFTFDVIEMALQHSFNTGYVSDMAALRAEDVTLSPFCIHISEALLAVAKCNRLNFKMRFDESRELLLESMSNVEYELVTFVKEIYKEGNFLQFLIVYAFIVNLTVYLVHYSKTEVVSIASLIHICNDVFHRHIQEKFMKRGGWTELKKDVREWWLSYRKLSEKVAFSDFSELFSDFLTKERLENYDLTINSYSGPYNCSHTYGESDYREEYYVNEKLLSDVHPDCQKFCLNIGD